MLGKALQRFGMGESAAAAAATVASMAGEGTLLGGIMAGTGDIAAQGYNIHAGNQTSINWKQTVKSTLVGGAAGFVTGGAIGMFSLTSAGQSFGKWMSEPTKLEQNAAKGIKQFLGDNRGSVSIEALLGKGDKKVDFYVTKDGVIIKNNIPENLIENPYRNGSYGLINNETGKFEEFLRIDPSTPKGQKGPSYSHYHINRGKEHLSPRPGDSNPLGY